MKFLKSIVSAFDVRKWEKKSKIIAVVLLAIFVAASVLALLKPSEERLMNCASTAIRTELAKDEHRSRRQVVVTYNDLYFINYASFSTSGVNGISEKYVGFAGSIYHADDGAWNVVGQFINYTYRMLGCGQSMLYGAKLTIVLTTISILVGLLISIFLALGKISKIPLISLPCRAYIFFFRGTPLMIQIFCIYLAIPGIFEGFSWRSLFDSSDPEAVFKGAFVAAVIAFTLNSAAYCAEIVRAAIQSIDKGQYEAAKALGLTYGQTMSKIIVPQSVRRMIPPVCNEFVMVLKDASLVFVIGLMDITTISKTISASGSYLVFVPAMVIYLIITAFFTFVFGKIEKKFSVYE
ncbi:MAG: amino acid ABC transporter permease [Acutalibacteraceae bacterium]|nr:amino acid ABC transporter permease [Bacillota bacterium]